MSGSHFTVSQSPAEQTESILRSLRGEVDTNHLRKVESHKTEFNKKTLDDVSIDLYNRRVAEMRIGSFTPQRISGFTNGADAFKPFLKARIPINYKQLKNHKGDVAVCCIPMFFKMPNTPTNAEKEAWQKRWDEDGDLYKLTMRLAPGTIPYPVILHTANVKEPVMFSLVLTYVPGSL